jgi:hypothetical protein
MKEEMEKKDNSVDGAISSMREFVVAQMKSEAAEWEKIDKQLSVSMQNIKKQYASRYVTIFWDTVAKEHIIALNEQYGRGYERKFKREDVGISAFRFWLLMRSVRRLSEKKEELDRKKQLVIKWKGFLQENKDLNRDINIGKILED